MPSFAEFLKNAPPEHVVTLARTVLQTHYNRQNKALQDVLEGFDQINWKGKRATWEMLSQHTNIEEAFSLFVENIDATLDGGEGPVIGIEPRQISSK